MAKPETSRSARRSIAARKPMDYDNEIDSQRDTGAPMDDHTLAEGVAPVRLIRPRYKEGPLIFRPYPVLDDADPTHKLLPGRKSAMPRGQSHWIFGNDMASYVGIGKNRHSFYLYRPRDQEAKQNNPYRHFYFACKDACDAGHFVNHRKWDSDWNKLMKGKEGEGAPISPPTKRWRCFGAVYQNGDKNFIGGQRVHPLGQDPGDSLTMIDLPVSAGRGLIDLLAVEKKAYDGDPEEDFAAPYKYGDAVGRFDPKKRVVAGGLFVTVFNPKRTKITKNTTWDGEIKVNQGYEVAVSKSYEYDGTIYDANLDSAAVDYIFDKMQFWLDDLDESGKVISRGILKIPSAEQQMVWIAQAFSSVPKLIQFVFEDRPEWITDEVRGIMGSRRGVVVPGRGTDAEDDEDAPEDEEERPRRRRREDDEDERPARRPAARKRDDEFEEEEEDERPARRPAARKRDDEFEEEEEDERPARRPATRKRDEFDDAPEEEEDDRPARRPAARKRDEDEFTDEEDDRPARRPAARKRDEDEFAEEEEDDDPDARDTRSLRERMKSSRGVPAPPDEDEDDEEPEDRPARRPAARKRDEDEFAEEEEEEEPEEEEEERPRARGGAPGGRRPAQVEVEDEDEFEEEPERPAPRTRRNPDADVEEAPKRGKRTHPADAVPDDEYFGASDEYTDSPKPARGKDKTEDGPEARSMAAANAARGRASARAKAPEAPEPAPPRSRGGTASRAPASGTKKPKGGKK